MPEEVEYLYKQSDRERLERQPECLHCLSYGRHTPAGKVDICPFLDDVWNDQETICNCCDADRQQCSDSI